MSFVVFIAFRSVVLFFRLYWSESSDSWCRACKYFRLMCAILLCLGCVCMCDVCAVEKKVSRTNGKPKESERETHSMDRKCASLIKLVFHWWPQNDRKRRKMQRYKKKDFAHAYTYILSHILRLPRDLWLERKRSWMPKSKYKWSLYTTDCFIIGKIIFICRHTKKEPTTHAHTPNS